jgi:antitoxin component YwqK of YwqJK toxin-antitoxin module
MTRQITHFILVLAFLSSCDSKEIHTTYYENGTLLEQYTMRNGEYDGAFKSLYSNGVPSAIGKFKNGATDGEWQYFFPDGKVQSIQKFDKGTLINLNAWDKQGVKIVDDGYGTAVLFYENGDTMSICHFVDNKQHGKNEAWFENGKKNFEQYYEFDKPVGVWLFWDEQGKLIVRKEY